MQRIEELLAYAVQKALKDLWNAEIDASKIQIQKTRKEFNGDITIVVFPMLRFSKMSPEQTADALGFYLNLRARFSTKCHDIMDKMSVIKYENINIFKTPIPGTEAAIDCWTGNA